MKKFFLVIPIFFLACSSHLTENLPLAKGTVRYISLEGGFYGIISDKNENFDPINLPKEYLIDGKRIIFTYKERRDLASFHMWGKIIEIIEIKPE